MSPRILDRSAWMIATIAVAVRLLWVGAFSRLPSGLSDPILYHGYALVISDGAGYLSLAGQPTSYYPPGYPYFLGGLYWVLDLVGLDSRTALLVGIVQSLLWGITALCIYATAKMLISARAGLIAGLLVALWPNLIIYSSAFLSESLFVAIFSGFVLAVIWLTQQSDRSWTDKRWLAVAATAAILLGAATMVRPQVLLSVLAIAVAWMMGAIGWQKTVALVVALGIGVLLFITPWAIRNKGVFDHYVAVSTNGGDNLCVGFHPDATGGFEIPPYCQTGEFYMDGSAAEYRRDVQTRQLALDWIREDPGALPRLSISKIVSTFASDTDGLDGTESYGADIYLSSGWRSFVTVLSTVFYVLVMTCAAIGLLGALMRGWRRRPNATGLIVLGLITVTSLLVPVLFFGDARFKVPATGLFAICAALFLDWVLSRIAVQNRAEENSKTP